VINKEKEYDKLMTILKGKDYVDKMQRQKALKREKKLSRNLKK
jgi:hypothetical protein